MEQEFNTTMQTLNILQSGINSLASVVPQNWRALDVLTAQQGGACAIIGEKCCFYVNQTGQVISNLNLLKEKIDIFHQINEAHTFYWTDLFPGLGDWFNGVWGNVLRFVLFCLFILILICFLFSLCRLLITRILTRFLSPQLPAQLLICETFREVSEEGTVGAQGKLPQDAPLWYADYFKLKTIRTQRTQEEYLSFPSQTA